VQREYTSRCTLCINLVNLFVSVSNSPLPSIIISFTLARDEKVDHYTRIKIHKLVILKFWIESDVNVLCS